MPDEAAIASVYSLIGQTGFERLVAGFYRQVPHDDLLGPLYPPDDLAGAEERLRGFLIFRFGGPDQYVRDRGHPKLRMRHAPFAIDQKTRDRWVQLMDQAIVDADLPMNAIAILKPFLHEVATFLINRESRPMIVG